MHRGAALAHDTRYDRTQVYDALYSRGYQVQSLNYSQSRLLLPAVGQLVLNQSGSSEPLRTALDVGCSHGFAVSKLWEMGLHASGVDLSGVAVSIARKARQDALERCVPPLPGRPASCFLQGSVADLPWPSRAFDVTMSSDVLEHVPPEKPSLKALEEEIGRHIQLHETVKHTPFWIDKFSRHGFYLRSRIRTPGHLCCAFVLQANDSLLSS
ncbi:hypothetical protein EMIHUDRAFT_229866 [Emiliania huxleyi CCMP1516]|uniref:Methyltransferase type 11 domain-containing protein n=2 Tax=Emiliania huxleyi TaxID=2903 RepID=A0A0D3KC29_EMIH1|nr:hypothetical protein EMIHUDRAFT_229866 [Emiliania huxleyi CCMP1516]EOD33314.1 hypothetical protein EMIHUDRAFT_229866 [Emiliania huxleyi CCMP1516]|eukprot:XP_005785743.1 hypothetical protein EMIHUDRAFT_229866 [Emiliania huxleyi CCMP1516]